MSPISDAGLRAGGRGPVASLHDVPVFCNALYPTAAEAKAAPRGDIELWFSPTTGYLWNAAFDPSLVAYSPRYENALHHSPRFSAYAQHLAERLVNRYDLHGKRIVEIGAGEGNFLAMLCELGENTAIGYDPSYDPARPKVVTSRRVTIRAEYYPTDTELDADLVVCQHVLEHLVEPAGLVADVRRTLRPDAAVYFEVPDATYMVSELAVWDLIYEHHSYFAAPTLLRIFTAAGFEPTEIGRSFGDQYLYVEARPSTAERPPPGNDMAELTKLAELVDRFDEHLRSLVGRWQARVAELVDSGPTAVWGAGSKGATFLNLVPAARDVTAVIDINPNKAGLHVPGTGHQIVAPNQLRDLPVDHVLVMNPLYVEEIRDQLTALGSRAEVIGVTD